MMSRFSTRPSGYIYITYKSGTVCSLHLPGVTEQILSLSYHSILRRLIEPFYSHAICADGHHFFL